MKPIIDLDILNAKTGPITPIIRNPMLEFNLDPLFQVVGSMVGADVALDPELPLAALAQMMGECKAKLEQAGATTEHVQAMIKGGMNQGLEEIVEVARSGAIPGVSFKWD